MPNIKNIIDHLPYNSPVMQIHHVAECEVAFKEAIDTSGWFKQEKARLDAEKKDQEYSDSPAGHAEQICTFTSLDVAQIAQNCQFIPEIYIKNYEQILEISFHAHRALEILDKHRSEQIMTRFEARE